MSSLNGVLHPFSTLIFISVFSRILCIFLASITSVLLSSSSLNSASILLDSTFPVTPEETSSISVFLWNVVQPFLRWDSEYFYSIAVDRLYTVDYHHAFFPGYPTIIQFINSYLPIRIKNQYPVSLLTIIIGIIISNICFVSASIAIYYLSYLLIIQTQYYFIFKTKNHLIHKSHRNHQLEYKKQLVNFILSLNPNYSSFIASNFFIISPSNIFMSSLYTESLFSSITFVSFILLICCELSTLPQLLYLSRHQLPSPFASFISLLNHSSIAYSFVYVLSISLLGFGTFTRSNGVFSLAPLFFFTLRTCPLLGTLHCSNSHRFSFSSVLVTLLHWFIAFLAAISVVLPLFSICGFAFRLYCTQQSMLDNTISSLSSLQSNFLSNALIFIQTSLSNFGIFSPSSIIPHSQAPSWCLSKVPNIYKFVQTRYWNVHFFGYWKLSKFDRFFYSIPFYFLSFFFLFSSFLPLFNLHPFFHFFHSPYLGFSIQLLVVSLYMGCIGNIEVHSIYLILFRISLILYLCIRLLSGCYLDVHCITFRLDYFFHIFDMFLHYLPFIVDL